jgi:hypothetical protein
MQVVAASFSCQFSRQKRRRQHCAGICAAASHSAKGLPSGKILASMLLWHGPVTSCVGIFDAVSLLLYTT